MYYMELRASSLACFCGKSIRGLYAHLNVRGN
jgi:hypothetical protein